MKLLKLVVRSTPLIECQVCLPHYYIAICMDVHKEGKNVTPKKGWIGLLCEEDASDWAFVYTCTTFD